MNNEPITILRQTDETFNGRNVVYVSFKDLKPTEPLNFSAMPTGLNEHEPMVIYANGEIADGHHRFMFIHMWNRLASLKRVGYRIDEYPVVIK